MTPTNQSSERGFALLMTLLVVSVVVSVTLSIIELSIKQLNLSVTARDSEIAFYAANAGMECVRYARRMASTSLEAGVDPVRFDCFNKSQNLSREDSGLTKTGADGDLYRYRGEVSWGTGDRCSVVDMVLMIVPETETTDMEIDDFHDIYSGFPEGETKSCSPGGFCTVAEVVGYNKDCGNLTSPGTVRREILLEF